MAKGERGIQGVPGRDGRDGKEGSTTFISITNDDIFNKLVSIEAKVDKQNVKIARALAIGGAALTLGILALTLLFQHVSIK